MQCYIYNYNIIIIIINIYINSSARVYIWIRRHAYYVYRYRAIFSIIYIRIRYRVYIYSILYIESISESRSISAGIRSDKEYINTLLSIIKYKGINNRPTNQPTSLPREEGHEKISYLSIVFVCPSVYIAQLSSASLVSCCCVNFII